MLISAEEKESIISYLEYMAGRLKKFKELPDESIATYYIFDGEGGKKAGEILLNEYSDVLTKKISIIRELPT